VAPAPQRALLEGLQAIIITHASLCLQPHLQAWLQSLLSPDTAIPDGAVAYISVGAQHFKATWQQEQGSWVVTQEPPTAAGLPSGGLSLLYVDAPVARLPAQAASSRGPSLLHRVSLLLQSTYAGRTLSFKGSDQTSAPPEQPAGGDALVISCIARGSWGTCLPVTVAGVEQDTEEQQGMETAGDCSSPLTALTVGPCCTVAMQLISIWQQQHLMLLDTCSAPAA
jgi:hypothetical protein